MQAHEQVPGKPGATGHFSGQPGVDHDVAPGTGRRLQIAVGALIGTLAVAYLATHFTRTHDARELATNASQAAATAQPVNTATVREAAAGMPLTLPGETAAWYQSTIHARVSGYVANWTADIGDHVKKGQVLATIETPELDASLAAAKAQLNASQAQVKVREARADFAKSTYIRWRDSPKGVVSEQEREDKRAGYESAVAELASARAKANLDQAQVDRLEAFERFKQVTAPYSGTITARNIDIGNLVTAGSTANTSPLYQMAKDDPIRVFVNVPQAASGDLMKDGVPAEIKAPGKLDHPIQGKIARTSEAMDPRARTFRAEVDIPNPDGTLVPGLYVDVSFQLNNAGMLQVPAAALVFRPDGPQVAAVGDDGKIRFKPVTIARDNGNVVDLASGVSIGERVVLNASSQLADGSSVRVSGTDDRSASIASPAP